MSDVKAAAKRQQRLAQWVSEAAQRLEKNSYPGVEVRIPEKMLQDLTTVSNAYLADHPPDDDEPITAEWLEAVGDIRIEHPTAPIIEGGFSSGG